MVDLADTSVPSWVSDSSRSDSSGGNLDATGVSYLLVGVGDRVTPILCRWREELTDFPVELIAHADVEIVGFALKETLGHARVGVRVRIAGSAGACLTLRAVALNAGLEDDEIAVVTAGPGLLEVFCTHCRGATRAPVEVGDTVVCGGCQRSLVVYHHVSRRTGRFLGYMVDAEAATS